uniref:TIR domain-containing protein n=1 Tax=Periophthalmus magnuspinnatus TaxID=409849 RepID=A0A3B4A9S5_9GOBI
LLSMEPHTSPLLLLLLFVLLFSRPSRLYSLQNCTLDRENLWKVTCDALDLTEMPSDVPSSALSLSVKHFNLTRLGRSDLSGLGQLQTLHLGSNQISHIESGTFLYSSALTQLSLSENELTVLTKDMFDGLSSVNFLHLGINQIQFIPKDAFGPLTKLRELHLPNNNLNQISDIVNILVSCPMLQVLNLRKNHLISFESDRFPFPLNITDLDLGSNPLRKFTLHQNVFPHLKSLSLSPLRLDLEWDVSDDSFLQNLRTLDLSSTDFAFETYKLIFQSVASLEDLALRVVKTLLARGLLDFACKIPSLRKLDLRANALSVLSDSLLQQCSDVTHLDLSGNSLSVMSQSSLQTLRRLSWLNLNTNALTQVPVAVRNMSTLTFLSIAKNDLKKLECSDFLGLQRLTELILTNNRLTDLNSCVFQDLLNLKILYIDQNLLYTFDKQFSVTMRKLLVLNAKGTIGLLQKGVFQNMTHLRVLAVGKGAFIDDGAFEGLTDLRYLSYSPMFNTETGAGLESASGWRSLSQQFSNMPSLQILVITLPFSMCPVLPRDVLQGLNNLTSFSSSRFFCKPHPEMFLFAPRLLNLEITDNEQWQSPDPKILTPLRDLRKLDLSENHLQSLDLISEANLTKLERLILTNNELKIIDEHVFDSLPSLKYLDLSGNLFVCNCSNAGFIQWVLSNKQVYVARAFQYRCAYPLSHQGELLLSFNVRSCWESEGLICFVTSSFLVLVTLLSSFVYHFLRWQLVYGYFLFRARLYDRKKRREGSTHVYDAFVSYNVHDEEWVFHHLVPELEERQGWKLCLHHRDFEPGKAIIENITDAIYSSRKTLCVISAQYLQSEWCSREIQMASFRLLDEQKDVLVLLFLEELSSNQLSPFYRVRKMMRSHTYLSWTQARSHRGLFWERVRGTLSVTCLSPWRCCFV